VRRSWLSPELSKMTPAAELRALLLHINRRISPDLRISGPANLFVAGQTPNLMPPAPPHGDTIKSSNLKDLEIDVSVLYLLAAPGRPRKYPFAEQSTAKLTSSHTTREPRQIGPSPEGPFFAQDPAPSHAAQAPCVFLAR
jgi:hypothetical protein